MCAIFSTLAKTYTVVQGDCLSKIASRFGTTWPELWNAPENKGLRDKRKSPDILFPGDKVVIPDTEPLTLSLPTGNVHEITLKATKVRLRLHLQINGVPLANTAFRIEVAGKVQRGSTDGAGLIDIPVPLDATTAKLECPDVPFKQEILLGHLDPADTITGAQARLRNLGVLPMDVSGALDEFTTAALAVFQASRELEASGALDDATVAALEEEYGC